MDRPILMSAPMVRAILAGTKTQTRRVVKPQPDGQLAHHPREVAEMYAVGCGWFISRDALKKPICAFRKGKHSITADICCPYGKPGDRLWVRETWMPFGTNLCRGSVTIGYRASNDVRPEGVSHEDFGASELFQRPDEEVEVFASDIRRMEAEGDRWRPSIFMPRWASRITLEIVSVRVERLQEISEADAWAEGIKRTGFTPAEWQRHLDGDESVLVASIEKDGYWANYPTARQAYAALWDSINGKGSWAANPWVWAVEFKRI